MASVATWASTICTDFDRPRSVPISFARDSFIGSTLSKSLISAAVAWSGGARQISAMTEAVVRMVLPSSSAARSRAATRARDLSATMNAPESRISVFNRLAPDVPSRDRLEKFFRVLLRILQRTPVGAIAKFRA